MKNRAPNTGPKFHKEYKLINRIKEKVKRRDEAYRRIWNNSLRNKFLLTCFILLILISPFACYEYLKINNFSRTDILFSISVYIFAFLILWLLIIINQKVPENNNTREEWLWRNARKLYFCQFLLSFSALQLVVAYLLNEEYLFSSLHLITILIGLPICLFIYYGIILYIFNNPNMMIGKLTIIGYVFYIAMLQFSSMFCGLIWGITKASGPLIIALIFSLRFTLEILQFFFFKDKLNQVQEMVLRFIPPKIVYATLSSYKERLQNKYEALRIIKKLDSNEKYGVLLALNEELLNLVKENYSASFKGILLITSTISIFVLGAISEGLIQDLFNDGIKGFLCKFFNILCDY